MKKLLHLVAFTFTGLWLLATSLIFYRRTSSRYEFPKNSFLNDYVTRFGDFYGSYDQWIRLGWGSVDYGLSYFPSAYFIHEFFYFFQYTPQDAIKTIQFISVVALILIFHREFGNAKGYLALFFSLIFFSYPMLFTISTGNLELVFFCLFTAFIYFFLRGKHEYAAIFLGLSCAPKGVMLIFCLVFFSLESIRQKTRMLTICLSTFVFTNLSAMLVLPGGVLSSGFQAFPKIVDGTNKSVNLYEDLMIFSDAGLNFGHSLIGSIRVIFNITPASLSWSIYLYSFSLLALCIFHFFIFVLRQNDQALMLFCISSYVSLSLPISTDYRLLYFVWTLAVWIKFSYMKKIALTRWFIYVFSISATLVVVPKPWFYLDEIGYHSAGVWLTPFMIIVCLIAVSIQKKISLVEKLGKI